MKAAIGALTLGLATWRLSHMLVSEDGPDGVFKVIREMSGVYQNELDEKPELGNNITPLWCVWCTSVWVGFLLLLAPAWFRKGLAASAAAIMIEKHYGTS